uniref:Uncharacterized protein TCIL3000_3_450 n=1 Tax=Trypanosoma congolense (strain IL3000) TaxID=1068625 RepID=G0UJS4_TRYCI|nr:unnamed protein product [Trypanosoma congolense IL3000]
MSYPYGFVQQSQPQVPPQQQVPTAYLSQLNQNSEASVASYSHGMQSPYPTQAMIGNPTPGAAFPGSGQSYGLYPQSSSAGMPYSNDANGTYAASAQYQQQQPQYGVPSPMTPQQAVPGATVQSKDPYPAPGRAGQMVPQQPALHPPGMPPQQQHQQQVPHARMSNMEYPAPAQEAPHHHVNYARPIPKRSVDLRKAPNPRRDIPRDLENNVVSNSAGQFPLSVCDFVGIDDGNANAKFFRPTTAAVPETDSLVKDSRVPFGAVLAPLCRPLDQREEVPVVSGHPPVRCNRCRAYISCHAKFVDMGRSWVCSLCNMSNTVDDSYFCNLDARGQRLDRAERPELSRGSVEYDVGAYPEYALRDEEEAPVPARPLHYLFLLDVSQKAATTFLPDYVDALLRSLHEMAYQYPECRVAFITYASTLHFYNIRHPRIPQMIVADVDNPFVPLPFTSLCWLTLGTELDLVDAFLLRVPEFAHDLGETNCAVGAAVQVAKLVLSKQHGGRVIVTAHKAPSVGVGAVKLREQHALYGTDKEKELLRPLDGFWKSTAVSYAKDQISVDLHMFADGYCELVTLSHVCHVTNGRVHLFADYDGQSDATEVQAVLDQALLEEAGYAGILRVRCSTGLRVHKYHGHFLSQDSHDMDLPHMQGSSTFFVEFAHESKVDNSSYAYFQTALLYTTRKGSRRVRVHSVRMPVATSLATVYEADLEATLMAYIHQAISNAVNKGLKFAREEAHQQILRMLIAYRRVCTSKGTSSLLMPTRLRLIPLYVLCLLKSDALTEGTTVRIDDRVQKIFHLLTIPTHQCLTYLYPVLYAAHLLPEDPTCGIVDAETGFCRMPPWQQLFYDSITSDGVYILCDEQARLVYLWVGSAVEPRISMELFGTESASEAGKSVFFDHFGDQLRNVLWACLNRDGRMRRLVILHEKERGEDAFFRQLKEEGEGGAMSYDDVLVKLHHEVNKTLG